MSEPLNIREAEEAKAKIRSGDWHTMPQLEGMVGTVLDSHDALAAAYREAVEALEQEHQDSVMCDHAETPDQALCAICKLLAKARTALGEK